MKMKILITTFRELSSKEILLPRDFLYISNGINFNIVSYVNKKLFSSFFSEKTSYQDFNENGEFQRHGLEKLIKVSHEIYAFL
jgi:hypothetical protein